MQTQPARPSLLPTGDWRRTVAFFVCFAVTLTGICYLAAYGINGGGNTRSAAPDRQPPSENLPPIDNEIEHLPERQTATTNKAVPLTCESRIDNTLTSTPRRDWKTVPVNRELHLEHPPEWEVRKAPGGGVELTSPAFPQIDVLAVVEPGLPNSDDDLLELIDETLGFFDPDFWLTRAGADTLAGRDACRGAAYAPSTGTNLEFWISASGDDVILILIAIPVGADRDAIADARGVAASLTPSETA